MFIVMQMIKHMIKTQTYGWQWAQPCVCVLYNAKLYAYDFEKLFLKSNSKILKN